MRYDMVITCGRFFVMLINETLKTLYRRRSERSYQNKPMDETVLRTIAEAGLYAPYAGDQKALIAVVTRKALLTEINESAKAVAAQMDMPHMRALGEDPSFHCLYGAPALIVLSGKEDAVAPQCDCDAAAMNILTAAASLGIGACWLFFPTLAFMSPSAGALNAALGIPDGYRAMVALSLGILDQPNDSPREIDFSRITYVR